MMKKTVFAAVLALLLFTRFVSLDWGLPYPLHPDERNMASAIESMKCPSFRECLNPHFFAYGQLPLNLSYAGISIFHAVKGIHADPNFLEATMALRILSALSSMALVFVLYRILLFLNRKKLPFVFSVIALLFFIFQPYAIQFAHFGTTESLLMLFYALIVYFSLHLLQEANVSLVFLLAVTSGCALGTKSSALPFLGVPLAVFALAFFTLVRKKKTREAARTVSFALLYLLLSAVFFILTSPHSLLNWSDFIASMNYESAVGLGSYKAFYTRQFEHTVPLLFQFENILPSVLGWPQLALSFWGFFSLPWNKKTNLLRFALLLSFVPTSFFYAKWTRFIAPAFPLFSVIALLYLFRLFFERKNKSALIHTISLIILIVPGVSYLSVYLTPDSRFAASEWIYKNIPPNSKILSESANVIDLPVSPPGYTGETRNYLLNSFNFYDLDSNKQLQSELNQALKQADYIIVPTRRVFKNHDKSDYPVLASYYAKLFSGKLGFEKVAEFSSFPSLSLFGKTFMSFPDENAEETWTVFDHPVVRIYKRKPPGDSRLDFTGYQSVQYKLNGGEYFLYIADSSEKWQRGLMSVRSTADIGGRDGMIFVFPDSQTRSFWNENTLSHLTLYWIKAGKVIGTSDLPSITETQTVQTVSSPGEADAVIEIIK